MKTAVLLLVYNRPEQTERVLKQLQECGAQKVFVSADGPKNTQDANATNEVKSILERFKSIINQTQFSTINLGCKNSVISGINWFFDQVEEGIILEDDCLPSPNFFPFIEDMLNRYRVERKVMMVSGNNPIGEWCCHGGHIFTRIGTIWGWATWKNRWQKFNPELPEFDEFVQGRGFEGAFGPTNLAASRKMLTKRSLSGEIDTWDYQWNAHILMSQAMAVIPERNLVENIGFDRIGTNIFEQPNWIQNRISDQPIIISERNIEVDREYEMEWELARRSNHAANHSSSFYSKKSSSNSKPLRILLINSTDMGGGAEKIALTLHLQLMALGHDSKLLVEVKKSALDSVEKLLEWRAQVLEFDPDVIHVHNLHGTSIKLNELAEVSMNVPVLFTLHDSWPATGSFKHPFEMEPSNLNLLDLIDWKRELQARKNILSKGNIRFTAPSQWMRERFFNSHDIRPFFVPNAVEAISSIDVEIPSKRFVLFVANRPETNPYKDFSTLKNAWKKANSELGVNGCDLIVLGGGPSTEKFENHSIVILEKQSAESVRSIMEQSVLVVQASVHDNAPLTIMEAHAAGKKVLGSLVGGIPELLDSEEQSWMYETGNVVDLTNKMVLALQTASESSSMIHASVESMTNTYLGHYLAISNQE